MNGLHKPVTDTSAADARLQFVPLVDLAWVALAIDSLAVGPVTVLPGPVYREFPENLVPRAGPLNRLPVSQLLHRGDDT